MKHCARIIAGILLYAAIARGAPDIPDYRLFAPGACIERDETLHPAWREALAALEGRRYGEAAHLLSNLLTVCPDDAAVRHQAALAAWGIGERAVAARWLVMAFRQAGATPATASALAALHSTAATETIAIGWLRRGLASVNVEERAYWVTRTSFDALWARGSSDWMALMRELGVPADRDVARAMGVRPRVEWTPAQPVEPDVPLLVLSPFSPDMDTLDRSIFMRREVMQRLIDRIRPPTGVVHEVEHLVGEDLTPVSDLLPEEP